MIRTFAIALVSLRAAIRSRLVLTLAVVLLATVVGLGLSVKGDGTLDGQVRVLLGYTLGLSALLLGLATLWTSCGGIAEEIREKHIQLLAVKPVHRFQIWLGKWMALMMLNAILLALVGAAACVVLQYKIRSPDVTIQDRERVNNEILTARRSISPLRESVDEETRRRVDLLIKEGGVPPRTSRRTVSVFVEKQIRAERSTVPPSTSKQWVFNVPANADRITGDPATAYSLRVRLYSGHRDTTPAKGTWSIGWEGNLDAVTHAMPKQQEGLLLFPIPPAAFHPGQTMTVRFVNADREQSGTVVFDPDGVDLLVRESSFEMNLIRSLVVLLCHLSLVAALGLTAGAIFSFPVATFMAASILVMSWVGHYFATSPMLSADPHAERVEPSLYYVAVERIMERLDAVIAPAIRLDPLPLLSDGILVSGRFTGEAVWLLSVLYSAVLFLIGAYCLKRREVALPE